MNLVMFKFLGGSLSGEVMSVEAGKDTYTETRLQKRQKEEQKQPECFEEGQVVRCVSDHPNLTKGKLYRIMAEDPDNVHVRGDNGKEVVCSPYVFTAGPTCARPGDKVRYVTESSGALEKGKVYTVRSCGMIGGVPFLGLEEEESGPFYAARFELVDDTAHPFKKGDLVECVDNSDREDCLTIGRVYEVLDTDDNIFGEQIVRVSTDRGECEFHHGCFRKVTHKPYDASAAKKGDRLLCVNPTGGLESGRVYEALEDAWYDRFLSCYVVPVHTHNNRCLSIFRANRFMVIDDSSTVEEEEEITEVYTKRVLRFCDGHRSYTEVVFVIDSMTDEEACDLYRQFWNRVSLPSKVQTKELPIQDSSMISRLAYNVQSGILDVTLVHSGKTYRYSEVTQEDIGKLLTADSLGKTFNEQIKGKKPCFLMG